MCLLAIKKRLKEAACMIVKIERFNIQTLQR